MNPDVLKIMAATAGALAASPFVLMSVRAVIFFNTLNETVKTMALEFKHNAEVTEGFKREVTTLLQDHGERLTRIESERRAEQRFGRHDDVPQDARRA